MVVYQGWFSGLTARFFNWKLESHETVERLPAKNVGIKCWPDMSDYTTSYHNRLLPSGNGQTGNGFLL